MDMLNCQPLLDRLTLVMVKSGAIRDFSKKKTPLEKIQFCLGVELTYDHDIKINIREEIQNLLIALYDKCEGHGKSEALALQAKTKGSKAYMKKKDAEALNCFTESICLAPADSTVLSLAYANRSAVFYQMSKYKEALQNIAWAESSCYPAALWHKLLIRRCRCFLMLDNRSQARESLEACKEYSQSIPIEAKEKYEREVADLEQKMMNLHPMSTTVSDQDALQLPSLKEGESKTVKYMTSAFEMRVNEKYGRHVVATEGISKGSEVFVEKPYAAILLPEYHKTHCHTCFSKVINHFPCSSCCDAIFCNEVCRDASRPWHQYECRILHILSSVGIAHLALRVILITRWKLHCDIRDEIIEGRIPGVGNSGVYNGPDPVDGYRAVYHLLPHFNNCLLEDQLQYCLAAILLATVISDKTDFMKENMDEMGKKANLDIPHLASAIMRHIAQLVSNAHAVTQLMTSESGGHSRVEEITQTRIASAIYSTASLMNHSCKPNIINSFYKDVLVIRTIQDINPGDQISNCYGPHYCRQRRDERQEALKQQYFFTCKCEPCTQPEYMRKEASWNGFYCEGCGGVSSWMGNEDVSDSNVEESRGVLLCLQCHKLQSPSAHLIHTCTQVNKLYESGEEALRKGNLAEAVSLLKKAIQLGSKMYLPANQYFIRVKDTLARALGASGDFEKCSVQLQECLHQTEQHYGSESIELAHELLKYVDVLELAAAVNDKYQDEMIEVKKKLHNIFTLSYGPQWRSYLGTSSSV